MKFLVPMARDFHLLDIRKWICQIPVILYQLNNKIVTLSLSSLREASKRLILNFKIGHVLEIGLPFNAEMERLTDNWLKTFYQF